MVSDTKPNSMTKGNWNKTKKENTTKTKTTTVCKLGNHKQRKLKSPLSDQNLLNRSTTSKCERCKERFTVWGTVFEISCYGSFGLAFSVLWTQVLTNLTFLRIFYLELMPLHSTYVLILKIKRKSRIMVSYFLS